MALPPDERRCTGQGKDGERCKAWAVKGAEGQLCAGHAGLGVAASPEAARAAQQAGTRRRSEKAEERREGFRESLQRGLAENGAAYWARLDRIVQSGSDADALRAMHLMMDRAWGKPKETVVNEHHVSTGTVWTPEAIAAMSSEERRAIIARTEDVLEIEADEVED